MVPLQFIGCFGLAIFGLWVTWRAYTHSKQGQFYADTPGLWPLGIFVWGDGLILGPFWILSAGGLSLVPGIVCLRYLLIFLVVRSAYEVIYWLNHQAVGKTYHPPLFRKVRWLGSEEAAILYQLLNMCQVIIGVGLLMVSYL